jgi:formylglycine-generating enzyme required for sulfatase activity
MSIYSCSNPHRVIPGLALCAFIATGCTANSEPLSSATQLSALAENGGAVPTTRVADAPASSVFVLQDLEKIKGWVGEYSVRFQYTAPTEDGAPETFDQQFSGPVVLLPCSGPQGESIALTHSGDWGFVQPGLTPYSDPGCTAKTDFVGYWYSTVRMFRQVEGVAPPTFGGGEKNCTRQIREVTMNRFPLRLEFNATAKTYRLEFKAHQRELTFNDVTLCPDGGRYGLPALNKWLNWAGGVKLPDDFPLPQGELRLVVDQPLNLKNKRGVDVTGRQTLSLQPQGLFVLVVTDQGEYRLGPDGRMPKVQARARVVGPDPDAPQSETFEWSYALHFNAAQMMTRAALPDVDQQWPAVTGPALDFPLDFGDMKQEGFLTVTASAVVDGVTLTGRAVALILDHERAKQDRLPDIVLVSPTPENLSTPVDWGPSRPATPVPPAPAYTGFAAVNILANDQLFKPGPNLANLPQNLTVGSGGGYGPCIGSEQPTAYVDDSLFAVCSYPAATPFRLELRGPDGNVHVTESVAPGGLYEGASDCYDPQHLLRPGAHEAAIVIGGARVAAHRFISVFAPRPNEPRVFAGLGQRLASGGCAGEINLSQPATIFFTGFQPNEAITVTVYADEAFSDFLSRVTSWSAMAGADGNLAQVLEAPSGSAGHLVIVVDNAASLAKRTAASQAVAFEFEYYKWVAAWQRIVITEGSAVEPPPVASPLPQPTSSKLPRLSPLVAVPAGSFRMGSEPGADPFAERIEQPAHEVTLSAYWMEIYEVSNAQYQACVQAGACTPPQRNGSRTRPDYYTNPTYASYPVINVAHAQAAAYCEWGGGRLPTEAEWERAARGVEGRTYPWGNEPLRTLIRDLFPSSADAPTPDGIYALGGNVWEWVSDWFAADYYARSPKQDPTGPEMGAERVVRGGSYASESQFQRAANRWSRNPERGYDSVGFRCVTTSVP